LLLIQLSFAGCGFSGRDNADHDVAKRVNHNQNSTQEIPANRDETVFAFVFILNGDGVFILKYANSIRETDAVLFQV
jgi:hypothetical protein